MLDDVVRQNSCGRPCHQSHTVIALVAAPTTHQSPSGVLTEPSTKLLPATFLRIASLCAPHQPLAFVNAEAFVWRTSSIDLHRGPIRVRLDAVDKSPCKRGAEVKLKSIASSGVDVRLVMVGAVACSDSVIETRAGMVPRDVEATVFGLGFVGLFGCHQL